VLPFTAHCAHGHDRIDFTDRELFTAHMTGAHKVRKRLPGGAHWRHAFTTLALTGEVRTDTEQVEPSAPGWAQGGILEPHPHKPPRRTAGGLDKVTERIAAGDYTWPSGFRWKADAPAAEAVPA
jgi:hypothetical protein